MFAIVSKDVPNLNLTCSDIKGHVSFLSVFGITK